MASPALSATVRTTAGKGTSRRLRAAGRVPAVIYGHGREPLPLAVETHALERLLEKISYATTVIELDVNGKKARTLIREIQRDPFRKQILHVDFQELVAGEKVTVRVPLRFVGTPEGVRTGGGILDEVMRELAISVDPANLPRHLDVDVTGLHIGRSLHVSDLVVPAGVTVLEDASSTVCVCMVPKEHVEPTPEEAAAAAAAPAEPELIRKPRAEGEEGEEGTAEPAA
jgi:large subunit ribosomal protein L25